MTRSPLFTIGLRVPRSLSSLHAPFRRSPRLFQGRSHRLGLVLDNLQIQNISDDVGYLTSVGRVRGAKVRRDAAIGEVRARATAAVQKAQNTMAAEIAKTPGSKEGAS